MGGISAMAWKATFGMGAAGGGRRLRVGIISDIHLGMPGDNRFMKRERNFLMALRHFRDVGVDGVVIAGDLAERGQREEMANVVDKWNSVFPDNKLPDGREVARLFVSGNHEFAGWSYGGRVRTKEETDRLLANSMKADPDVYWREFWREPYLPVSIKELAGYKFVLCHYDEWNEGGVRFLEAHRAELEGEKPFFFIQHCHPAGTVYSRMDKRSVGAGGGKITEALSRFPNAVVLSGHSHLPLTLPQSIWQGAFTSIGTWSTSRTSLPEGRENGFKKASADGRKYFMNRLDARRAVGFLVMDVHDDRLVFERLRVDPVEKCGDDWIIPLPACSSETSRPYAFEPRASAARPPRFPGGAEIKVSIRKMISRSWKNEDMVVLEFPRAEADGPDGVIFDYGVEVKSDGVTCLSTRLYPKSIGYSEMQARESDGRIEICGFDPGLFRRGKRYDFTITPYDAWGLKGDPLSCGCVPRFQDKEGK